MIECRLMVLTTWPGMPTADRKVGQFRVGYNQIIEELSDELERLNASDVALAMAVAETNLRKSRRAYDGWPKADTRPGVPGLVISFDAGKMGRMQYACDTYLDWKDNLRAISLTLTALRAVDRYGATAGGQQYTGFKALPPPPSEQEMIPSTMEQAAAVYLATLAGTPGLAVALYREVETFDTFYQELVNRLQSGEGDEPKRRDIAEAAEILRKHHKVPCLWVEAPRG